MTFRSFKTQCWKMAWWNLKVKDKPYATKNICWIFEIWYFFRSVEIFNSRAVIFNQRAPSVVMVTKMSGKKQWYLSPKLKTIFDFFLLKTRMIHEIITLTRKFIIHYIYHSYSQRTSIVILRPPTPCLMGTTFVKYPLEKIIMKCWFPFLSYLTSFMNGTLSLDSRVDFTADKIKSKSHKHNLSKADTCLKRTKTLIQLVIQRTDESNKTPFGLEHQNKITKR